MENVKTYFCFLGHGIGINFNNILYCVKSVLAKIFQDITEVMTSCRNYYHILKYFFLVLLLDVYLFILCSLPLLYHFPFSFSCTSL